MFFLNNCNVDLGTPWPTLCFFTVLLLTEGATLQITRCFHRCYDGTRILHEGSLWAYLEGVFLIGLTEVRRPTLNAGSTFPGCPDIKGPKGNASAFAGLPSHLGNEVTYAICLALSRLLPVLHQSLPVALQESSRPLAAGWDYGGNQPSGLRYHQVLTSLIWIQPLCPDCRLQPVW